MRNSVSGRLSQTVRLAAAAVVAVALTGCPASTKPTVEKAGHAHDEHAVPTTLAEAHHELEHMGEEIKEAFLAGKPADAHDQLHQIGAAIEALPALAKKAGIEAEEEVKQVTDDLMDSFTKLDGVLHKGPEVKWEDVSEKIDAAVKKIEGWLPEGGHEEHASHDEDGDHDEHAGHDEDGDK